MNKNEDVISMFLGLGIVVVIVFIIVSFVLRSKGNISLPGISTENTQLALTTPTELNKTDLNTYEVQKGDSLWSIAQNKYGDGNKWVLIAKENNLKNASMIEVSQKLVLPDVNVVEVGKAEVTKNSQYTVMSNDSLWKIATVEYGDGNKWVEIWNLNKNMLTDPNLLEVGMILKLR